MKKIFIVFPFLFIGNHLLAQTRMLEEIAINSAPKTKLLYESEKGFVYALPLVNMPCLVQKIQSNMPIAKSEMHGYIPNTLLKRGEAPIEVIPLKISPLTTPKGLFFQKSETINKLPGKK